MLKQSKKSIPEPGSDCARLVLQTEAAEKTGSDLYTNTPFDQFFNLTNDLVCLIDFNGNFKKINQSLATLLGVDRDAVIDQPFAQLVHPADRQQLQEVTTLIKTGQPVKEFEGRYCCNDCEVKWLSWSISVLPENMVLAIGRDVTDKRLFGEELNRKSEELRQAHHELKDIIERYQVFVQQSSEIIWRCELQVPLNINDSEDEQLNQLFEGYIAECNDQMAHFYGYASAAALIGSKVSVFFDASEPVTNKLVREFIRQGYKIHRRLSMHVDCKGNKRYFLNNLVGVVENGLLLRVWTTQNEITETRQSQEALRISEERYRSVVHAMGEGIVMYDKNGEIITCNRSAEAILGVPGNMLSGRTASGTQSLCIYEDGRPFPPELHPSLITLKTGRSLQQVVMGIRRTDGSLVWISMNTEPVYYTQQKMHPDAVVASFVDITQKKAAEQELIQHQQQLKEYSERISNILDSITDGFIAVDKNSNIILWNHAVEEITGLDARSVIGAGVEKIFPNIAGSIEYIRYIDAINKGTSTSFEHFIPVFNRWLETSVYPFSQGAFIYFRDITERKKQESLLELEKEVLKINARPAASLKTTVDFFLEGLERTFPGMMCSVITLNDDKLTFQHLSAPSLPAAFTAVVNGTEIGPAAGSCGAAIYRKEKIITTNIATDPLWANFRDIATACGLQSCWSFPIANAASEVLATIAVYHRHPAIPSEKELNLFERVSSLLRIIIEHKNAEAKIRLSNERYLLVTKATNDAIWDWDVTTNSLYWGEGIYTLFGFKPGYIDNSHNFWESCIHPEDRDRVVNGMNRFIANNTSQIWEDEYRFQKPNGDYALVYDRGFLIFDHTGKITRMVGSMQDITDKKELEKKLLKQELDKQKLIAQAVVNAQEKERAEIGKELHDNVNQILSTAKLYLELAQTDDEHRLDLINRSTNNISDAINEIRTISRSLVPPSVGDLGLIESVQDLVENIRATRKLHVEFYFTGNIDDLLDEKRKLMLFRIIQEQVNNVLKHSMAKNLVIELIADNDKQVVDLTISDDGQGFEPEKVRSKKGVGLQNIASRAQLFNGSVHIVTALGQGCKLKINVPISNF
jgi:PAS domain S-box-containing protein